MPLIYITGISGAGKSAVCKLLKAGGAEAYDADEEGFNGYYEKETNKLTIPSAKDNAHTKEWNDQYVWKTSRKKVEDLVLKAKNKKIYFCGVASNNREIQDLFDQEIILMIDEETLHHRITTRTTNEYGKTPEEMENILNGFRYFQETHTNSGSTIINATQPVEKVVEEIIEKTIK